MTKLSCYSSSVTWEKQDSYTTYVLPFIQNLCYAHSGQIQNNTHNLIVS